MSSGPTKGNLGGNWNYENGMQNTNNQSGYPIRNYQDPYSWRGSYGQQPEVTGITGPAPSSKAKDDSGE